MKKHIWIVNHYATKMFIDQGGRHYWLARELKKKGYEPVVFCASTIHNTDKSFDLGDASFIAKSADDVPYVFIKAPAYQGNGVARFRNMLAFTSVWKKHIKDFVDCFGKPDVIYASSVHPFSVDTAIKQAHRLGLPCLAEFRDLWPDVLIGMGALSKHHPLALLLAHLERKICRQADGIIFTMQGGKEYLRNKGYDRFTNLDKVYYLNNGVDLAAFDENMRRFPDAGRDLKNENGFKVVYTGSIRRSYQLDMLLDAAKIMRDREEKDIKILCWGQGDELNRLNYRVKTEKISNVEFRGAVDRTKIPAIISNSDCNIIHCEELVGAEYGVSFIKLFDYLAAGRPIISTVFMGNSILDEYKCGITAAAHDAEHIADAVINLKNMPPQVREQMGLQAREAAKQYDITRLAEKLAEIIETV